MFEAKGRVFEFVVKRTLEWSKKGFDQRRASFLRVTMGLFCNPLNVLTCASIDLDDIPFLKE